MRKFFIYINWVILAALLLSVFGLRPLLGGSWWLFVGSFLSSCIGVGYITLRYFHLPEFTERDLAWRSVYFKKPYVREVIIQLGVNCLFLFLAIAGSKLALFVFGYVYISLVNIVFEWLFVLLHPQYRHPFDMDKIEDGEA